MESAPAIFGKETLKPFLASFRDFSRTVEAKTSSELHEFREHGIAEFERLGFPTQKNEDWKYTNLKPLLDSRFSYGLTGESRLTLNQIKPFIYDENWPRIVFVNGRWNAALSSFESCKDSLGIESLRQTLEQNNGVELKNLKNKSQKSNAFMALNDAFLEEGAIIRIKKGAKAKLPLHILFVHADYNPRTFMTHPRILILAETGSEASIIEDYAAFQGAPYWDNSVTQIKLAEASHLDYYRILRDHDKSFHVGTVDVEVTKGGVFNGWSVCTGGHLTRSSWNVELAEEGAEASLDGLYLVSGTSHVDHHILVNHPKPHGTSRQLFKGILNQRATAAFSGKVYVQKNAQKTDAAQTNKNLLLSENANVDTRPQLEIEADDVKCTHGAAVGELDENQIYYLKSRGISEDKARRLLTYGFASEVIQTIKLDAVRNELDHLLLEELEEKAFKSH